MITSVYLSNNMIQIVVGDKGSKKPHISHVIQEEVSEGSLLNGVITNEQDLLEQLKEIWHHYKLSKKNVELVLNSAKIVSRNVALPTKNDKNIRKLLPMEFNDVQTEGVAVYDYVPLGQVKENNSYEVLAIMVEEAVLKSFVDIFGKVGINLRKISFARVGIQNYLAGIKGLNSAGDVVLLLDGNSLISILWAEGKMAYMDKKRLFVEPGTPQFISEVVRNVSNICQIHSTRNTGKSIGGIYTAGFTADDIDLCEEQLPEAGLDYSIQPLPCHRPDAIFAGSGLVNGSKELNLLATMKSKKKEKSDKPRLMGLIPVFVTLAICIVASVGLFAYVDSLTKTLEELEYFNQNSEEANNAKAYDDLQAELTKKSATIQGVTMMTDTIATYPAANSVVKQRILGLAGGDVDIDFLSYDNTTGGLKMVMKVDDPELIYEFINRLEGSGLFFYIEYTGYVRDEAAELYSININTFLDTDAGDDVYVSR
jgi:hypothetical protein